MSEPRTLTVVDPGALTTVQDLGRPGHAHLGVPRSGAVDAPALRLANRLVGNDEGDACLETTATGVAVRFSRSTWVAVTGAPCPVAVDGRAVAWSSPMLVPADGVLQVGVASRGLRSMVAVAGGITVPAVLGSRSTDLLSGLGPAPLRAGDVLPLGEPGAAPPAVDVVAGTGVGDELFLITGPRADWFTADSLAHLDGSSYVVAANSNRIGLRLSGPGLDRARDGELPSEPMVLGAVQVPPDGQPVVLLNDHATTGGYPVVGVICRASLPVCAQLRPGDRVSLRVRRG